MARVVAFEPDAWQDFGYWQIKDKRTTRKILDLIKDIQREPFLGKGHPEPLKHDKNGHWSRHIDKVNRLTYRVTDDAIIIISCRYHYEK